MSENWIAARDCDKAKFTDRLRDAASKGRLKAARTLVAAGADVNAVDDYGATALMQAALGKNELVTDYLLEVTFFFVCVNYCVGLIVMVCAIVSVLLYVIVCLFIYVYACLCMCFRFIFMFLFVLGHAR